MQMILQYVERSDAIPLLQLYIHGAPHRRVDIRLIEAYREELVDAARRAMIIIPIRVPVEVTVLFIDPTSTDLDNLITALWRAMDGSSHRKPTILADDGLVESVKASKFYPNGRRKRDMVA